MSHDKIKNAARKRVVETGEPYSTARREDTKEHEAAHNRSTAPDTSRLASMISEAIRLTDILPDSGWE
jgi:hypothetical protein